MSINPLEHRLCEVSCLLTQTRWFITKEKQLTDTFAVKGCRFPPFTYLNILSTKMGNPVPETPREKAVSASNTAPTSLLDLLAS